MSLSQVSVKVNLIAILFCYDATASRTCGATATLCDRRSNRAHGGHPPSVHTFVPASVEIHTQRGKSSMHDIRTLSNMDSVHSIPVPYLILSHSRAESGLCARCSVHLLAKAAVLQVAGVAWGEHALKSNYLIECSVMVGYEYFLAHLC
jgi:hypothetical protein